jgi:4-hydroxy-tetrahydrodipicolinate synthase
LSHEEHNRVIELCVEEARGRVPVIAGTGSNATDEAIALTKHAREVGCDAVLSVTGYYNKPTQEGQYRHFMAIADAVDIPIVLYNIPGRAVVSISVETMARLAKHPNIIGVKDATADLMRPSRERLACGPNWLLISGEDGTALGYNAHGGSGCISVTANIAPRLCAEFQAACTAGDFAKARTYQDRLMPLHDALFCETSPAPVKYAASLLGLCSEDVRLPMAEASEGARAQVKAAMQRVGLKN